MDVSLGLEVVNSKIDTYLADNSMLSEEEIIAGCKLGKRKAQHELYNRYSGSMFGVVTAGGAVKFLSVNIDDVVYRNAVCRMSGKLSTLP